MYNNYTSDWFVKHEGTGVAGLALQLQPLLIVTGCCCSWLLLLLLLLLLLCGQEGQQLSLTSQPSLAKLLLQSR
jgi:hypothetical protein